MNIGEHVGDYEIVQVLGAGGMGEVYKVRNVLSERVEAMKILLPNMAGAGATVSTGGGSLAERFQREIKVQAALDHPNIAKLYTAMTYNNQLLMLMEFVDGSPLSTLLELGFVGVREAVDYTAQVLDALAYAHERGVVHRDIKPANIMRTASGKVKLLDFGIARMKTDPALTQTGHTVGSLYYMSPEQIKGLEPDPRSDLYSVGIMLYEMVTGRRPFQGDSAYSIMAAHLGESPQAPIEVVPGVPSALSDIIVMAMAKDPAARFQTAQAFGGALRSVMPQSQQPHVATHTAIAPPPFSPQPAAPTPASSLPPTLPHPSIPATQTAVPPPPAIPPIQQMAPPIPPPIAPQPVQSYALPQYGPPQPQYSAPIPPPPPPAPRPASRRGLYMALGSVATLAVLAAAVIEGPKLLRARAGGDSQPAAVIQPAPSPMPAAPAPAPSASTPTPSAPAPAPSAPTAEPNASAAPAPQFPVEQPPAQPSSDTPAPAPVSEPSPAPRPAPIRSSAPAPPVNPALQREAPVYPQQAPPPQATPQQAGPSAELKELREQYNLLSVRVSVTKAGLRSIEQQMARQGVGMRGDIREASVRVDYLMKEAQDAIRSGDVETARRNLTMAENSLAPIEKFLGR